ncbi:hypothetical protein CDD80_4047 [Ophiocordyceps camponoti-rufipedis]|uniref:Uncharacterized protein n=1 Tax=Ophiocordyceps camponoti-rufipedis TaxID=2004952 RepID=A0A2C5ZIW0_9HYPO|nr:hypothetical protein CDD80_4047 [Ophiocordyceps camponoti-rufipedis]
MHYQPPSAESAAHPTSSRLSADEPLVPPPLSPEANTVDDSDGWLVCSLSRRPRAQPARGRASSIIISTGLILLFHRFHPPQQHLRMEEAALVGLASSCAAACFAAAAAAAAVAPQ